jgi:hypothetical protein
MKFVLHPISSASRWRELFAATKRPGTAVSVTKASEQAPGSRPSFGGTNAPAMYRNDQQPLLPPLYLRLAFVSSFARFAMRDSVYCGKTSSSAADSHIL